MNIRGTEAVMEIPAAKMPNPALSKLVIKCRFLECNSVITRSTAQLSCLFSNAHLWNQWIIFAKKKEALLTN